LGNRYDAQQILADLANIKGEPIVRNYLQPGFQQILEEFFAASVDRILPGDRIARLTRWQNIPLMLKE
jgi:hypothetical protein